jgi:hypothetical protein
VSGSTQPFFQFGITGLNAASIGAIATSARGQADGVASLGPDKKVPWDQLPESPQTEVLSPEGKLKDELIPDRCLTYASLNSYGGVPQISGETGQIPEWTIPSTLINRIAFLEAEVTRLAGLVGQSGN